MGGAPTGHNWRSARVPQLPAAPGQCLSAAHRFTLIDNKSPAALIPNPAPPNAASLLLEAADLLMPPLRTLWRQATSAATWLLVRLVGQAVALVRRGVQQGSSQAAAAAAAQGKPRSADQQRRQRRGRRRQAGPGDGGEQQGSGDQPVWALQG